MKRRLLLLPATLLLALSTAFPAPVRAQDVSVELILATGIEEREPVGESTSFPANVGQVYAWMRITGLAGQALEIVWTHEDETFSVPLEIGGSPWRTWSSKTIPPDWTGDWRVEVQNQEGTVLAARDFTVG